MVSLLRDQPAHVLGNYPADAGMGSDHNQLYSDCNDDCDNDQEFHRFYRLGNLGRNGNQGRSAQTVFGVTV